MGSECLPGVDPVSNSKIGTGAMSGVGAMCDKGKNYVTKSQGMPAKSPGNKDKNKMPSGPQGRG